MTKDEAVRRLFAALAEIQFADRYYTLCDARRKTGPDLPVAKQHTLLAQTGRGFTYDKREAFFAIREATPPAGCEALGLNISLRDSKLELIFVFRTPAGRIGGPFTGFAHEVKALGTPEYKHDPPAPRPGYTSEVTAGETLAEALALYDEMRQAIGKISWKSE